MNLPADKLGHLVLGAVIAGVVLSCCFGIAWLGHPITDWQAIVLATCAVVVVGVLKEVFDFTSRRGTPEQADAYATMAGAIPVLAPAILQVLKG